MYSTLMKYMQKESCQNSEVYGMDRIYDTREIPCTVWSVAQASRWFSTLPL